MAALSALSESKTSKPTRVAFIALGINSADELQPLICLSRSLSLGSNSSVVVAIVTHPQYADVLGESGVAFLDGGPCPFKARSTTPEGRALDSKLPRADGEAVGDRLSVFMKVLTTEWFAQGQTALTDFKADAVILCSTGAVFVYPSICELCGNIRFAVLDNSPMAKTAEFGPPRGFGNSQAGFRWVNESRWDLHAKSMWSFLYRSGVNAAREKHRLPPDERELGPWEDVDKGAFPVLLAYSEVLLGRPLEWGKNVTILGPLIDADRLQPLSPPLLTFVEDAARNTQSAASSSLVYVTFGEQFNSVSSKDSRLRILSTCLASINAVAGTRAVVVCPPQCGVSADALRQQVARQSSPSQSDACLILPKRPHPAQEAKLWGSVPNVVVLCSGDPWTVHASVLAGAPLVCLDFGRDDTPEAFWGSRAFVAGVAAEPVPVKKQQQPSNPGSDSGAQGGKTTTKSLEATLEDSIRAVVAPNSPVRAAARAAGSSMRSKQAQTLAGSCQVVGSILAELAASPRNRLPSLKAVTTSPSGSSAAPPPPGNNKGLAASAGSQNASRRQEKAKEGFGGGGAAAEEEEDIDDGKRPAGFSFSHRALLNNEGASSSSSSSSSTASHVWKRGDDSSFRVRCGPNYKKNGRKAPSGASLYELVHVDLFKSSSKMEGFSRVLRYPQVPRDTHHAAVPALFVVNGSLPLEAPQMMSPTTDGPTLNALFYFAIKQSTCDALASGDLASAPNAVKLLLKWCSQAETQPDVFAKFKCIGMVRNYEEAGMPSMFKSFNGKPVLIRNRQATKGGSGFLQRGTATKGSSSSTPFLEMNVHIRLWPYLAKQGLGYLMAGSHKTDLEVGFVLEGASDDELPEVLIGSAQLTKLKMDQVISWPDGAQGKKSGGKNRSRK